jgi:alanyl-tRNA synthetase
MNSREVRQAFLDFFGERGHRIVSSSPLVLPNDPTLLFANAGMNQFKEALTGRERREYVRAASSQKCLRVSGKHNDLEMVGRTPRHHTFFEMLGNFSFGDYFKDEAIEWAWDLVTRVYGLPEDRLWVTVFGGTDAVPPDEEAAKIWRERVGVPAARILRLGEKDNFWRMGDTGPCGPCSEIHYDLGEDLTSVEGESNPATDESRYIEIWNLVFMQFDQLPDGTLEPLSAPSIDTGMGLERITSVLQGHRSNYDSDLFRPILEAASARAGTRSGHDPAADFSLRVIADHVRALCFLVTDGVVPANDKRGYVLRRILRRAIRHGRKLGIDEPFLHEISPVVIELLGGVFPELESAREAILEVGRREEERFGETLATSLQLLDRELSGTTVEGETPVLGGKALFRLYDTFGLPLDLARDIAEERGIRLDEAGFEEEMARQRARAQASWKGAAEEQAAGIYRELAAGLRTSFEGYDTTELDDVRVLSVLRGGQPVPSLEEGQEGEVILEATPFYAEAGGQIGDTGMLSGPEGRARVADTRRPAEGIITHQVRVESGRLALDQRVRAEVDASRRERIRRNHTATHLLHAALREVVGTHVKQAGSLVAPDRLRFDFSHFASLSERAQEDIETLVNARILEDLPVEEGEMDLDEALRGGAMALFGERYGDRVRVIRVGDFSLELCGGTHCSRSGEIGLLKITQEKGIASGTRRVEAVTGEGSLERFRQEHEIVRALEETLSVPRADLLGELGRRLEQIRALQKELESLRMRTVREGLAKQAEKPEIAGGVQVIARRVDGLAAQEMRVLADNLRQKLGSGVVILGRAEGVKASLLVAVTPDLKDRVPAGELIRDLAKLIGGGGGGRADLAEAGGKDPSRLDEALRTGVDMVARKAEGAG